MNNPDNKQIHPQALNGATGQSATAVQSAPCIQPASYPIYPTQSPNVIDGVPSKQEHPPGGCPQYPGVYPGDPVAEMPPKPPGVCVIPVGVDEEESHFKGFDFSEQSIRRAFIRKVYSILMCQLMVTAGVISFFVYHEPTNLWCRRHWWIVYISFAMALVCILTMACSKEVRRKSPHNLIFLAVFTFAESIMLGTVSAFYDGNEVLIAMGVTGAICLALTLFAMQTKWDFTMMGGGLLCALVVLIIFGSISCFVYRDLQLRLWLAAIGVFLFSLYLIYDTQLMMGGKHKYTISPEEYVFAALNLYLDIINIFLRILYIFGRR